MSSTRELWHFEKENASSLSKEVIQNQTEHKENNLKYCFHIKKKPVGWLKLGGFVFFKFSRDERDVHDLDFNHIDIVISFV